jgi:hypothetical protein
VIGRLLKRLPQYVADEGVAVAIVVLLVVSYVAYLWREWSEVSQWLHRDGLRIAAIGTMAAALSALAS